ncbi:MAG: outer membrane beta-barrel protein [bacterium]
MRAFDQWCVCVLLVTFLSAMTLAAQEQSQDFGAPWVLSMRVGGEYSDNRDGTSTNKQSNLDSFVEPQIVMRYQDADRTTAQFALMPLAKWHSNPRTEAEGGAQKDAELFGAAELAMMHRLTPTVTLNAGDRLAYNDDPRMIETGTTTRRSESYVWNDVHMGGDVALTSEIGAGVKAGSVTTRYQDSRVAKGLDTDLFTGEVNTYCMARSGWKVLGILGASEFKAEETTERSRGSAVETYDAGLEKKIMPGLVGKLMGGLQVVQYDNSTLKLAHMVNEKAELIFRGAAPMRFRCGVEYGYAPPGVSDYSAQKSITLSGEVDRDVLADRLTLRFQGQYMDSQYTSEGVTAPGGSETLARVGAHGTYRLTEKWAITSGYTFEKWDSQLRESFTRNLVDVSVSAEW